MYHIIIRCVVMWISRLYALTSFMHSKLCSENKNDTYLEKKYLFSYTVPALSSIAVTEQRVKPLWWSLPLESLNFIQSYVPLKSHHHPMISQKLMVGISSECRFQLSGSVFCRRNVYSVSPALVLYFCFIL